MIQLTNIDDETEALFSHLRGLAIGEEEENLRLVDDFSVGINFHSPSLYSFVDNDSLYNPVINNLVKLLLRVIPNSSKVYLDLLDKLLAPLTFQEICVYIPKEAILESLRNSSTQGFTLRILTKKIPEDKAAVQFFTENDLVYVLITDLIENNEYMHANSQYIAMLVAGISSVNPDLLPAEKFKFLTNLTEDEILTLNTFGNYDMALTVLTVIDFSHQPWGAKLFPFNFTNVLAFHKLKPTGDCLLLLVTTYLQWIGKVPFSWLKPFLSDLLEHVILNHPNRIAFDFANEYVTAYQMTLVALLNSTGDMLEFGLEMLSRPDVDIVDINVPDSRFFFMRVNLENIPEKRTFFKEHFIDMNLKPGKLFIILCVIHLIENEEFFNLLVEYKMLTNENIKHWQKDYLFIFFRVMSREDFSAQYLISELPYLVLTYLLTVDRTISAKLIWDDKKEALRELLLHRKIDLGPWKKGLSDCLYEMENGRRYRNIEPQVGIMNDSL